MICPFLKDDCKKECRFYNEDKDGQSSCIFEFIAISLNRIYQNTLNDGIGGEADLTNLELDVSSIEKMLTDIWMKY